MLLIHFASPLQPISCCQKSFDLSLMISTTKVNLPAYIVGSAFYNSLSSDDNEEFCVPEGNLKLTPSVENVDELSHLLNTLQYWGVATYPGGLIAFLSSVHSAQYQEEVMRVMVRFESLRELLPLYTALQNLVSKSKRSFADRRSVSIVIPLLYGDNEEVVGLSALMLGDVAAFCTGNRDCVFGSINFSRLLDRVRSITTTETVRNVAVLLSRLAGLPSRSLYVVQPVLPLLTYLLGQTDIIILTNTCKALGSICDNKLDCIETVLDLRVAPRIMELIRSETESISIAGLYLVGTLTSQVTPQLCEFLDLDLLAVIQPIGMQVSTCSHVAWIVHNIACGSASHLQAIYDRGLLPGVVDMLQSNDDCLQAQAMRAVAQVINRSTPAQMTQLLHTNVMSALSEMLWDEEYSSFARSNLNVLLSKVEPVDPHLYQELLSLYPNAVDWAAD